MKALAKILLLSCVVWMTACGKSGETTNGAPAPVDPTAQNQVPNYTPVTDPGQDGRLPDLTTAVALRLPNPSDYSGLEELAQVLYLPLVGDPKIRMTISGDRTNAVTGSILVGFEDRAGWWGADVPSFSKTGYRNTSALDMIFADDELLFRVVGAINGNNLDGNVYYRVRQSGENACRKLQTCTTTYAPYYPYPPTTTCRDQDADIATAECRSYMDIGSSSVRLLGNFHQGSYSSWLTN